MSDLVDLSTEELEALLEKEEKDLEELKNLKCEKDYEESQANYQKWIGQNHSEFSTSNPKRHLSVSIYTDDACENFGRTQETEAQNIEKVLRTYIGNPMTVKHNVLPHDISACDIYIFDVGGLADMEYHRMENLYRLLYKVIEDRPNTVFVMWSSFTKEYNDYIWSEIMNDVGGDKRHNVIHRTTKEETWLKQCIKLLG